METQENKKKLNIPWRIIFNIAIIGLTIFLIVFFIFSDSGLLDLINSGLKIDFVWLSMAVAVHLLNIVIDATVIYLFVKQTTPHFSVYNAFIASMTGQFFCAVTPSASGGQPMQILVMSRMGVKGSNATSALVQKFLVWQFTLAIYCLIAVVTSFSFFSQFMNPAMWVFSVVGFLMQVFMIGVLLLASFCKSLTSKIVSGIFKLLGKLRLMKNPEQKILEFDETLTSFHESNKELNKNKALMVKAYVVTAIQMTALFLVPYCIAKSFHIDCDMFQMICAQAYVNMTSSLVPLPGGSGAAEYCFNVFFGSYFTTETMKSAILIWRTISYYGTIAISAPFASFRKKKSITTQESVAE